MPATYAPRPSRRSTPADRQRFTDGVRTWTAPRSYDLAEITAEDLRLDCQIQIEAGRGRPALAEQDRRDERVLLRCTAQEKAAIEARAAAEGLSVSDYLRGLALA